MRRPRILGHSLRRTRLARDCQAHPNLARVPFAFPWRHGSFFVLTIIVLASAVDTILIRLTVLFPKILLFFGNVRIIARIPDQHTLQPLRVSLHSHATTRTFSYSSSQACPFLLPQVPPFSRLSLRKPGPRGVAFLSAFCAIRRA